MSLYLMAPTFSEVVEVEGMAAVVVKVTKVEASCMLKHIVEWVKVSNQGGGGCRGRFRSGVCACGRCYNHRHLWAFCNRLPNIAHTLPVSLNNVGGVFVGACSVLMGNFWDAHSTETLLESDISVGLSFANLGLFAIGNGSKKLRNLILSHKGLEAIAIGCKELTHLEVNGCHNIRDLGLESIGRCCKYV
ncbi:hypothetical protein Ahy_A06g026593 isoform H [Arachis hypogaea]|uniref:F-box/LRR-repeat protein n=1 Tax=Arachis hypogaea TaxID=3818 RepID=A0A445CL00_ARAHY|nr:hypothetical protein Ahy_A06g026593 isoform H [Arachis hypogaea]